MADDGTELDLGEVEYARVLDEAGSPLLIVDRLVNPSGHYVVTISTGDDVELLQFHSVDTPGGPASPYAAYRVAVGGPDGAPLLEVDGSTLRLFGRVEVG